MFKRCNTTLIRLIVCFVRSLRISDYCSYTFTFILGNKENSLYLPTSLSQVYITIIEPNYLKLLEVCSR